MVTRVHASLLTAFQQSSVKPLVTVLAFTAFVYVLIQVAKSLQGRVQPIDPNKLHQEGRADFRSKLYDKAIEKFTLALRCKPKPDLCMYILMDRSEAYAAAEDYDKAQGDLYSALLCRRSRLEYESFNASIRSLLDYPTAR